MSRLEKALRRIAAEPKDFTWQELVSLMTSLGYRLEAGAGSRRKFKRAELRPPFNIHEPHPNGILKMYAVRQTVKYLISEGHLHD